MRPFSKVVILGTGLIGGSMALAIKRLKLAKTVAGLSRHKESLALAKRNHVIDTGSRDLGIVRGADLIIFATPPQVIKNLAPTVARLADRDCLITDVASTKDEIAALLDRLFSRYVGTHPLAGSQKRGVRFASGELFKSSLCILTVTKKTNPYALSQIKQLWQALGSRTVTTSPCEHDLILSFTSHLPHLLAFSLIAAVPEEYFRICSGGLKDTTRIGSSDPRLWAEIFLTNRKNLLGAVTELQRNISRISALLRRKNKKELIKILRNAKNKRERLL